MYFLNLSLLQFLAVFGTISAISVALYLLDRSRRKLVVSTLRFWIAAEQPAVAARRRRVQQPWSLLLQLLSMALLLLAISQLRLGSPAQAGRDHVIVLDTFGLDGGALRESHPDGRGARTGSPISQGAARTRPGHAAASRRHGHAGNRV
jgi:hypothetical protein